MLNGSSPRPTRVDRKTQACAVLALRRRMRWFTALYLAVMAFLLVLVAYRVTGVHWELWLPLGITWVLAYAHGQQMASAGWDMRSLDEQIRVMGEWRILGAARNGEPVTLTGHMAYTARADIGRLTSFVHVDLSADD